MDTPARELIALEPDVMLVHGTLVAAVLQRQTRSIPIVFVAVSDPIGAGLIGSLARPGSNLTGFLNFEATIVGKWLAMLKEIAPKTAHAMLLCDPKTTDSDYFLAAHGPPPRRWRSRSCAATLKARPTLTLIASMSQVLRRSGRAAEFRCLRDLINAGRSLPIPAVYALRFFAVPQAHVTEPICPTPIDRPPPVSHSARRETG
jgi:hypothetical protein